MLWLSSEFPWNLHQVNKGTKRIHRKSPMFPILLEPWWGSIHQHDVQEKAYIHMCSRPKWRRNASVHQYSPAVIFYHTNPSLGESVPVMPSSWRCFMSQSNSQHCILDFWSCIWIEDAMFPHSGTDTKVLQWFIHMVRMFGRNWVTPDVLCSSVNHQKSIFIRRRTPNTQVPLPS